MARLDNRTDYTGAATQLGPHLDGTLFNWHLTRGNPAHPVTLVTGAAWSGFLGANRDALGITSVGALSVGLEFTPGGALAFAGRDRVLGTGIFGPHLHGSSLGLTDLGTSRAEQSYKLFISLPKP